MLSPERRIKIANQLSTRYAKCKLQFPTQEREYFEQVCGFTDEELDIFRLRSRGYSIIQISFKMEDLYSKYYSGAVYGTGKVEARIRSIKDKILNVL